MLNNYLLKQKFLYLSDIVLSVNSTVLFEALRINKRIGCFNWFNYSNPLIYDKVAFSIDDFDIRKSRLILIKEVYSLKINKNIKKAKIEKFLSAKIGISTGKYYSDIVEKLVST